MVWYGYWEQYHDKTFNSHISNNFIREDVCTFTTENHNYAKDNGADKKQKNKNERSKARGKPGNKAQESKNNLAPLSNIIELILFCRYFTITFVLRINIF